jgi:hypothetical protein
MRRCALTNYTNNAYTHYCLLHVLVQGGTHYGIGHYGYQPPMLMGFQSRDDQQLSSALSAHQWLYNIMSSITTATATAAAARDEALL